MEHCVPANIRLAFLYKQEQLSSMNHGFCFPLVSSQNLKDYTSRLSFWATKNTTHLCVAVSLKKAAVVLMWVKDVNECAQETLYSCYTVGFK